MFHIRLKLLKVKAVNSYELLSCLNRSVIENDEISNKFFLNSILCLNATFQREREKEKKYINEINTFERFGFKFGLASQTI